MRLVTWNCCRGPFSSKVPLAQALEPDVAVLQECARPAEESPSCLWFGESPRQGITVLTSGGYRVDALPNTPGVPRFTFPVQVTGPERFLILAVWSQRGPEYPYVEAVIRAVELYRDLICSQPTVVIGNFNSNAIWDGKRPPSRNHGGLVQLLSDVGLASSYHAFFGEVHGAETRPTHYFQWNERKPFHIDYCFIPRQWLPRLEQVHVGSYSQWKESSDHRPLTVDLASAPA